MGKKNVHKMNLKILFMKWYQIHNFSFFVKSYALVPLPKMQKFIKKRKQLVKLSQYQNVRQKVFAQLLRLGKKNDTTSWHNCSTNIDPGAKNDKTRSKQNL